MLNIVDIIVWIHEYYSLYIFSYKASLEGVCQNNPYIKESSGVSLKESSVTVLARRLMAWS